MISLAVKDGSLEFASSARVPRVCVECSAIEELAPAIRNGSPVYVCSRHCREDEIDLFLEDMENHSSPSKHDRILQLHDQGLSLRRISEELSVPRSTLQSHIERHKAKICLCFNES